MVLMLSGYLPVLSKQQASHSAQDIEASVDLCISGAYSRDF